MEDAENPKIQKNTRESGGLQHPCTAKPEEVKFEQQLSVGDILEKGNSNSEKMTYIHII